MAAYYFKVFYGLGFVPTLQEFVQKQKEFIEMNDPIQRGQQITEYFHRFNDLIQMKVMMIRATTEEFKD